MDNAQRSYSPQIPPQPTPTFSSQDQKAKHTTVPKVLSAKLAAGISVGALLIGGVTGHLAGLPATIAAQEETQVAQGKQTAAEASTRDISEKYAALKKTNEKLAESNESLEDEAAGVKKLAAELKVKEANLKKRETTVAGKEKQVAANTIEEGTWTVGTDIKAGTYRVTESVGRSCYWAIYRSGTNGSDIIQNDIPGGGRPTVTLSKGQDFTTKRCGSWRKR